MGDVTVGGVGVGTVAGDLVGVFWPPSGTILTLSMKKCDRR